jgi:hypothetical protein
MLKVEKKGPYKCECPTLGTDKNEEPNEEAGTSLLANGTVSEEVALTQGGKQGSIPKNWVLLDNQSTVDVFSNAALLQNIRKVGRSMHIQCTAGVTSTNMMVPGRHC